MSTNREIKFRVYVKDLGYIVYNPHTGIEDYSLNNLFKGGENSHWMQYTGLKDKNGKEIYEGDFLRLPEDADPEEGLGHHWLGIVTWNKDYASWYLNDEIIGEVEQLHEFGEDEREVIGNIYENKEL